MRKGMVNNMASIRKTKLLHGQLPLCRSVIQKLRWCHSTFCSQIKP